MSIVELIMAHAKESPDSEVCGLVVSRAKKTAIIRGYNTASDSSKQFDMDPGVWLEVADDEAVVGIYHSHPSTSAKPSEADLAMCEMTNLPWHIVNPNTEDYFYFEPTGYQTPYLRRPYVYGVHDCYTLARDWYQRELGVSLPQVPSKDKWWDRGENKFVEMFSGAGFVALNDQNPGRGDIFLIRYMTTVPSHCAVYMGNGTILHHVANRASSIDNYSGVWSQCTTHHLRHTTSPEKRNG